MTDAYKGQYVEIRYVAGIKGHLCTNLVKLERITKIRKHQVTLYHESNTARDTPFTHEKNLLFLVLVILYIQELNARTTVDTFHVSRVYGNDRGMEDSRAKHLSKFEPKC